MIRSATRYFCLVAVAFSLTTLPILQTANAAIISTDGAMDYVERQDQIERINTVLARDSVQKVLIEMGVDPEDASARVLLLTDTELQTLEQHLAELPAGGVGFLEVVGIVAIVLIVLELLNVTNFFSEF